MNLGWVALDQPPLSFLPASMDFDEDEQRPLGDFGTLLGAPTPAEAEDLARNEELDMSGAKQKAWLVKVCLTLVFAHAHTNWNVEPQ